MTQIIGNILARRTDSRGYTITITDYVDEQSSAVVRCGKHWITDPGGETVKAGYWMDWAESDMDQSKYATMSRPDRAALECWNQVERYKGLASNFEHSRFGEWLPMDTFATRLTKRFMEVWQKYPRMYKDEVWEIFFSWASDVIKEKGFLKQFPKQLIKGARRSTKPLDQTGILIVMEQSDEQPTVASPALSVAHEQPGSPQGESLPDMPESASTEPGAIDPFEEILIRISTAIHEEGSELCSNAAVAAATHVLRHWHDTIRDHVPPLTMHEFKRSFREDIAETRQAFWEIQKKLDALLKVVRADYPEQSGDGQ